MKTSYSFQVGDQVVVKPSYQAYEKGSFNDVREGVPYTILKLYDGVDAFHLAELPATNNKHRWWFRAADFTLYAPEDDEDFL